MSKVFMWMFVGLLTTFGVGYIISNSPSLMEMLVMSNLYWGILLVEVIVVILLSVRVMKMKRVTATIMFILYSILNGVSFASIFVAYEMSSLIFIFLVTSVVFLLFAIVGKVSSINMTKWGIYLLMALVGVLILSIINIFVFSNTLNMIGCGLGILVFCLYVAYDINRIKQMEGLVGSESNMAIYMALQLYIDFINLFIRLLQLFGKRDD